MNWVIFILAVASVAILCFGFPITEEIFNVKENVFSFSTNVPEVFNVDDQEQTYLQESSDTQKTVNAQDAFSELYFLNNQQKNNIKEMDFQNSKTESEFLNLQNNSDLQEAYQINGDLFQKQDRSTIEQTLNEPETSHLNDADHIILKYYKNLNETGVSNEFNVPHDYGSFEIPQTYSEGEPSNTPVNQQFPKGYNNVIIQDAFNGLGLSDVQEKSIIQEIFNRSEIINLGERTDSMAEENIGDELDLSNLDQTVSLQNVSVSELEEDKESKKAEISDIEDKSNIQVIYDVEDNANFDQTPYLQGINNESLIPNSENTNVAESIDAEERSKIIFQETSDIQDFANDLTALGEHYDYKTETAAVENKLNVSFQEIFNINEKSTELPDSLSKSNTQDMFFEEEQLYNPSESLNEEEAPKLNLQETSNDEDVIEVPKPLYSSENPNEKERPNLILQESSNNKEDIIDEREPTDNLQENLKEDRANINIQETSKEDVQKDVIDEQELIEIQFGNPTEEEVSNKYFQESSNNKEDIIEEEDIDKLPENPNKEDRSNLNIQEMFNSQDYTIEGQEPSVNLSENPNEEEISSINLQENSNNQEDAIEGQERKDNQSENSNEEERSNLNLQGTFNNQEDTIEGQETIDNLSENSNEEERSSINLQESSNNQEDAIEGQETIDNLPENSNEEERSSINLQESSNNQENAIERQEAFDNLSENSNEEDRSNLNLQETFSNQEDAIERQETIDNLPEKSNEEERSSINLQESSNNQEDAIERQEAFDNLSENSNEEDRSNLNLQGTFSNQEDAIEGQVTIDNLSENSNEEERSNLNLQESPNNQEGVIKGQETIDNQSENSNEEDRSNLNLQETSYNQEDIIEWQEHIDNQSESPSKEEKSIINLQVNSNNKKNENEEPEQSQYLIKPTIHFPTISNEENMPYEQQDNEKPTQSEVVSNFNLPKFVNVEEKPNTDVINPSTLQNDTERLDSIDILNKSTVSPDTQDKSIITFQDSFSEEEGTNESGPYNNLVRYNISETSEEKEKPNKMEILKTFDKEMIETTNLKEESNIKTSNVDINFENVEKINKSAVYNESGSVLNVNETFQEEKKFNIQDVDEALEVTDNVDHINTQNTSKITETNLNENFQAGNLPNKHVANEELGYFQNQAESNISLTLITDGKSKMPDELQQHSVQELTETNSGVKSNTQNISDHRVISKEQSTVDPNTSDGLHLTNKEISIHQHSLNDYSSQKNSKIETSLNTEMYEININESHTKILSNTENTQAIIDTKVQGSSTLNTTNELTESHIELDKSNSNQFPIIQINTEEIQTTQTIKNVDNEQLNSNIGDVTKGENEFKVNQTSKLNQNTNQKNVENSSSIKTISNLSNATINTSFNHESSENLEKLKVDIPSINSKEQSIDQDTLTEKNIENVSVSTNNAKVESTSHKEEVVYVKNVPSSQEFSSAPVNPIIQGILNMFDNFYIPEFPKVQESPSVPESFYMHEPFSDPNNNYYIQPEPQQRQPPNPIPFPGTLVGFLYPQIQEPTYYAGEKKLAEDYYGNVYLTKNDNNDFITYTTPKDIHQEDNLKGISFLDAEQILKGFTHDVIFMDPNEPKFKVTPFVGVDLNPASSNVQNTYNIPTSLTDEDSKIATQVFQDTEIEPPQFFIGTEEPSVAEERQTNFLTLLGPNWGPAVGSFLNPWISFLANSFANQATASLLSGLEIDNNSADLKHEESPGEDNIQEAIVNTDITEASAVDVEETEDVDKIEEEEGKIETEENGEYESGSDTTDKGKNDIVRSEGADTGRDSYKYQSVLSSPSSNMYAIPYLPQISPTVSRTTPYIRYIPIPILYQTR